MEITSRQVDILKHSIGYDRLPFHRNFFTTEKGCDTYEDVMALTDVKLLRRGKDIIGGLECYHLTDDAISMMEDLLELDKAN